MAEQIEAERRATEQYKAQLDKEVQAARALAEAEGRIKENRANEDINRRQGASHSCRNPSSAYKNMMMHSERCRQQTIRA